METGYRRDNAGGAIPRDIIEKFVCTYNGEEVFRADLFPAMAANPFIAFTTVATESGTIAFSWANGAGETQTERSEEHTSELQSRQYLVCRLLLEKKKKH